MQFDRDVARLFAPALIRPYVENLLNENGAQTKLMLIIDNAQARCQKCMDGKALLNIYRPCSAKVILLVHQLSTFE